MFRFTIARKIAFTFLIILLLMAATFGIILHLNNIVNKNHAAIEEEASKQGAAGKLRFSIAQLNMFSNDYIITEKDDYRRRFELQRVQVDDYEKKLRAFKLSSEELTLIDSISADIDSIYTYAYRIFAIPRPRSSSETAALMEIMEYKFGTARNRRTTEIFNIVFRKIEEHRIQSMRAKEQMLNTIYTVLLLSLVVSSIVVYLSVQKISKPIRTLVKEADSIAKGDYTQRSVVSTRDEIGLLARSFSRMAEEIEGTHKNLEARKRFTENIVATVPSGLIAISKNSEVTSVNRSFCELFDVRQQDAMGKNIDEVLQTIGLSEECRDVIAERMQFRNLECVCSIPGKGELTLNLTLSGIRFAEEEEEEELLLVIDDITERKRAEEELIKVHTAIEQSADCTVITDKDGIIQYVNPAFTQIYGYTIEEALGKTPRILKSGFLPQMFYEGLWRTILSGNVFQATFLNKKKDGEIIYILETITPIKDKNDNVIYFIDTGKDITEQRKAEMNLKQSEERFRNIYENLTVGIYRTTPGGKVLMANPAMLSILGFDSLEDFQKINVQEIYIGKIIHDKFKEIIQEEGYVYGFEYAAKRKDGRIIYVRESAKAYAQHPLDKNKGDIAYFEGTLEDITEQKKLVEELTEAKKKAEAADKMKSEFLAQMSHEIRSPLNAVLNFTNIIKEETSDIKSEELEISFSSIDSASKRIIRTVDSILNMSDLQLGTYVISKRMVDLNELLGHLVLEYKSFAEIKKLDLRLLSEVDYASIEIDDYAVNQIFANLIDNAIKYTNEGFVEIRLLRRKNKYIVEIKDSGIGISDEYLPDLFSPFSQEEQGYSRKFEGAGLGMSLVKKYCDIIRAIFKVESKKDVGTTFSVILKN